MSRPAPTRALLALVAMELRLAARRGENVLISLLVPPAVLLFFAATGLVPGTGDGAVDFLLPGSIALAIIASAFVSLGIATAFERAYGVLKRLGGAPVTASLLVTAKVVAMLVIVVLQVGVLVLVAWGLLGWSPGPGASVGLALGAIALGTAAFAGLGLLMAGTLRAEATLALANALFLAFLMLGGIVLPTDHLPAALQPISAVLPATALADLLRVAFADGGNPAAPAALLVAWAAAAAALTARTFRWS
ncbi:MAG TPA: ABC transporter permease [Candidatus Deferrimicrobiaceae bacterium]|nr:ABC transporter permease [Candidatus Deferrimicrobiaceae bacterium]